MAEPTKFAEANSRWVGQGDIGDLPTYGGEGGVHVSCWKLSWRERLRVLWTGRVWLLVWAEVHPAVLVSADYPFEDKP